jgi:hypothetical protein
LPTTYANAINDPRTNASMRGIFLARKTALPVILPLIANWI